MTYLCKKYLIAMPCQISKLGLLVLLSGLLLLSGCATSPPQNPENLCEIFKEKRSWYKKAKKSYQRWKVPIPIMMSIMYQESSYKSKAKPPRKRFLFFPAGRVSSSYGYSQAKDDTWRWYEKSVGRNGDRDNFADAIDFIGWYNHTTHKTNKVSKQNAYALYLAYHEGHGGYKRGSYQSKAWLKNVAKRVEKRSKQYQAQLDNCRLR